MTKISRFIAVAENIHCTRVRKTDGRFVRATGDGASIVYKAGKVTRLLPVQKDVIESEEWRCGKVRHCAVAIRQALYGTGPAQAAGRDYIRNLAADQAADGAVYMDVNVDEFSTDVAERVKAMRWTVLQAQESARVPVSVDSSNLDVLKAGLETCNPDRGRPMLNSVSLERPDAIELAARFNAVVVASAAGEHGLPSGKDDRLSNIRALMPRLRNAGLAHSDIHLDPLVLPISTDSSNGRLFLDTVSAIREEYGPEVHIVAGLSNVSYGMPNRKLINQVFSLLAVRAGADGGIVDPGQINLGALNSMDTGSRAYQLAEAMLLGKDEFGMEFIAACREGGI